jgi:manganese transport protein
MENPYAAPPPATSPDIVPGNSKRKPLSWLWGPAFVAAVAYVDPGNVAANLTSGARYGYRLVWVLALANTIAVMVQYLSAKTGLVTGRSLPELLGRRLRRRGRIAFLAQAELVAIATDLAEVIGGAIALQILFQLPLFIGGLITGIVSMGLLWLQSWRGQRTFEYVVLGLLLVITIGFVAGLFVTDVNWGAAVTGLIPSFDGADSVLLATSMLGATVMPHAIYAHSALVNDRDGKHPALSDADAAAPSQSQSAVTTNSSDPLIANNNDATLALTTTDGMTATLQTTDHTTDTSVSAANTYNMGTVLRSTRWEVITSMLLAGSVNIAMLLLAAAALGGSSDTDSIQGAHAAIESTLGPVVGVFFGIGLLASGLASTSVGSYAGVTVVQGLLHRRVSIWAMRVITIIPALLILALGVNPTWALVLSQVLLSLGIPFALVPLVTLSGDKTLMGSFANSRILQFATWAAVVLIIALNLTLVYLEVFS